MYKKTLIIIGNVRSLDKEEIPQLDDGIITYEKGKELSRRKTIAGTIKNMLGKKQGGSWKNSEIKTIVMPCLNQIYNCLSWLNCSYYSIFIYLGHGCIFNGEQLLEVNENLFLSLKDINNKLSVRKRLTIIDACRNKYNYGFSPVKLKSINKYSHLYSTNAGNNYLKELDNCSNGHVTLFSTQPDKVSIDGQFSNSLFVGGLGAKNNENVVDFVNNDVIESVQTTTCYNWGFMQTPEVVGKIPFPFVSF